MIGLKVSHHLLLCATPTKAKCCDPAVGAESWSELKRMVKELGLEKPDRPEGIVLRSKADCLRICERGPILLIWPEGVWYSDVTPNKIQVILNEHIINQNPVEEWVHRETPFAPEYF